jgi:hypothetical protein
MTLPPPFSPFLSTAQSSQPKTGEIRLVFTVPSHKIVPERWSQRACRVFWAEFSRSLNAVELLLPLDSSGVPAGPQLLPSLRTDLCRDRRLLIVTHWTHGH